MDDNVVIPIELIQLGYPSIFEVSRTFHTLFIPCSIVTNLFTAYVIQTRSVSIHGNLKNYVIIHQLCNALMDLIISGLCQPVVFFPHLIFGTTGPLKPLFPPYIQACMCVSSVFLSASSGCNIALYKYQSLLPFSSRWKITKAKLVHFICAFNMIIWTSVPALIFGLGYRDQNEAKTEFLMSYPWAVLLLQSNSIYVDSFSLEGSYLAAFIILFYIIWVPFLIASPFACLRAIKCSYCESSDKIQLMHKSVTKTLFVQIYFSLIFIAIPVAYFIIALACGFKNEYTAIINTAVIWIISGHSICTSIFILILWKSYRTFAMKRLCVSVPKSSKPERHNSIASIT